jgi:hypothetical protein
MQNPYKEKMKKRFYIGIDIGKLGAIHIIENDKDGGGKTTSYKMPMIGDEIDYQKLHEILEPFEGGNGIVVFEKLGQIFNTSKAVAFSMGYQAGAVEMCCIARSIPYIKISAKEWQKEMFTGVDNMVKKSKLSKSGESRDTKGMALIAVKRLFPGLKLTFGDKATKPHDGLIDAILMAEYAIRKF